MMASKTFLANQIKELEEKLKKQQNGNFLLKRKADELIILNANLQKEINGLRKEKELSKRKPWYKFW